VTDEQIEKIRRACAKYGYGDNPFDAVPEVLLLIDAFYRAVNMREECAYEPCGHPLYLHNEDNSCSVGVAGEEGQVTCDCEGYVEP